MITLGCTHTEPTSTSVKRPHTDTDDSTAPKTKVKTFECAVVIVTIDMG
jgi:hypothetical protein